MGTAPHDAQRHLDWINLLRPDGLVVSAAVLEDAQVHPARRRDVRAAFRALLDGDELPSLRSLTAWLRWPKARVSRQHPWLRHDLPALDTTVLADAVVQGDDGSPRLVVSWCPADMDERAQAAPRWTATDQELFERLLIDTGYPVGLHVSPTQIRLTYAPAGEAPGRLTFPVAALAAGDGSPLIDALQMLLGHEALFERPIEQQLPALLQRSRKHQERVTVALAGQVEDALRILLAGFDAADRRVRGTLLREVTPEQLYDGLTSVLLRLVFLLYAEDRGLLPVGHPLYAESYALGSLAERLAAERVLFASAMDRRFGAWARLCTLFRLVFRGARHGSLRLPPREGDLFDPARFPFLEGREDAVWGQAPLTAVPRVDDGVVAEVLERLLYLDGQRISYQNLEVEEIGSVYEALMGFEVIRTLGPSLHLRPHGGVVDLHALRATDRRVPLVAEAAGEVPAKLRERVPALGTFEPTDDVEADLDRLHDILGPMVSRGTTRIEPGRHALQPGEQRRRSASHYTPRSLTQPIVERTLAPLLFGPDGSAGPPTSSQILALRICDPAMGSGAFLAEAARYLGKLLVQAAVREGTVPADLSDPETWARRRIVERCLYGVDKDPRAVQLARLSMWLITSASELPFTFVDHALREGDALVGLDAHQTAAFALDGQGAAPLLRERIETALRQATTSRLAIVTDGDRARKLGHLAEAEQHIARERRLADLVVASVWAGGGAKEVRSRLTAIGDLARLWYLDAERELPEAVRVVERGLGMLRPFHWPLELPEVFSGDDPGFDAVIGNPPFGGKNNITAASGPEAIRLLQALWPHAHGASDYAAYFFVRARQLLKQGGTFGLVATNTIAQGHTRATGLRHLVEQGVTLYDATVDMPWPVRGAAVVVSVVHGARGPWAGPVRRNGAAVDELASDLSADGELPDPVRLRANAGRSFIGSYVLGRGFVLDPEDASARIVDNPENAEIIRPYLGGQDLNTNVPEPTTGLIPHGRYVIAFGERTIDEAEAWPELLSIVREQVKPERDTNNRDNYRLRWWRFAEGRPGLYRAIAPLQRCLVCARVSKHLLLAFQPTHRIFSEQTVTFAFDDWYTFGVLQSQVHEPWARLLASTHETRLRYTPSRCFETFPFPNPTPEQQDAVANAARAFDALRSELMIRDGQGLTQLWNRLVDSAEQDPGVVELRQRRESLDRSVLAAYGWTDLAPTDRDAVLHRLRRLNAERAVAEQEV